MAYFMALPACTTRKLNRGSNQIPPEYVWNIAATPACSTLRPVYILSYFVRKLFIDVIPTAHRNERMNVYDELESTFLLLVIFLFYEATAEIMYRRERHSKMALNENQEGFGSSHCIF